MEETQANTSGMGRAAAVPPEIRHWNWGAFCLNWVWGLANGVYVALLTLIPFVNIVMVFILGVKGNEWAWQSQRWDSLEHFKSVQRKWSMWGLGIFIAGIVFLIIGIILAIVMGSHAGTSAYNQ